MMRQGADAEGMVGDGCVWLKWNAVLRVNEGIDGEMMMGLRRRRFEREGWRALGGKHDNKCARADLSCMPPWCRAAG